MSLRDAIYQYVMCDRVIRHVDRTYSSGEVIGDDEGCNMALQAKKKLPFSPYKECSSEFIGKTYEYPDENKVENIEQLPVSNDRVLMNRGDEADSSVENFTSRIYNFEKELEKKVPPSRFTILCFCFTQVLIFRMFFRRRRR